MYPSWYLKNIQVKYLSKLYQKGRVWELTLLITNIFFFLNVISLRKPDEKVHFRGFQILLGMETEKKILERELVQMQLY